MVVGVTDEAIRIELADEVAHFTEVRDPARSAHVAFVADAPSKDAGMIARFFDHFANLLLGQGYYFGILELSFAELPDGYFGNQQDSVAVGIVQNERILRIVHRTGQGYIKRLHIVVITPHGAFGFGQALPDRILMACDASQSDPLSVDQQVVIANLDFANSKRFALLIQQASLFILELHLHAINRWMVQPP